MSKALYRLGLIIAFIPLVLSQIIFSFLPETIPIHFSLTADPDAWSPKWSFTAIGGIFTLPIISIVMFKIFSYITPSICKMAEYEGQDLDPKHWWIFVVLMAIFMLIAQLWILVSILLNV